jgi:hypothetical protein
VLGTNGSSYCTTIGSTLAQINVLVPDTNKRELVREVSILAVVIEDLNVSLFTLVIS